jgi:hypothetical protein
MVDKSWTCLSCHFFRCKKEYLKARAAFKWTLGVLRHNFAILPGLFMGSFLLGERSRCINEPSASSHFWANSGYLLSQMVRVVVTTAIREVAAGSPKYALLRLASIEDRRATAPPAPPQGLILADVGYETRI